MRGRSGYLGTSSNNMASHSEGILGKDIYAVTDADLEMFFSSEQEETALLEFKSGDTTPEAIAREVCAFANADGGLLIVGAPRETSVPRGAQQARVCQGPLTTVTLVKNKAWLSQKIASLVVPAPPGMRVHETVPGKHFLIEIPKSSSPPHQLIEEGAYYFRFEHEAKRAPHGLVQALFMRRVSPDISVSVENLNGINGGVPMLTLILKNNSPIPAKDLEYHVQMVGIHHLMLPQGAHSSRIGTLNQAQVVGHCGHSLISEVIDRVSIMFQHTKQTFFLAIGTWSTDTTYRTHHWCIDPVKSEILFEGASDGPATEGLNRFLARAGVSR